MRYVTLFPETENIHLTKDVGMIPYILHKVFSYKSKIACYANGDYPYLNNEVKGLELDFIKRYTGNSLIDGCIYLIKNSRKIDVLQTFHCSKKTLLWLILFKILNRKGKTYLKLDGVIDLSMNSIKRIFSKFIFDNFIDLVTIENQKYFSIIKNKLGIDVTYLPNGFYDYDKREEVDFHYKENVICTVGRIGTYQKANEVLLQAIEMCHNNISDWRIKVIGPIEKEFKLYIENYFEKNPELKEKIIFTGTINDRNKLEEEYKRAKIFCLTSRFEGFPLVFTEAIKNGCYIVTSNVLSVEDITNNGIYGSIFNIGDYYQLANYLTEVCNDNKKLKENCKCVQDFAYNNFYWPKICSIINNKLRNV